MISSKRPRTLRLIINSSGLMMHRGSRIQRLPTKRLSNLRKLINLSSHNLIMGSRRPIAARRTQNSEAMFSRLINKNRKPNQYSQRSSKRVSSYSKAREVKATGKLRQLRSALCSHQISKHLWKQRKEIVSNCVPFFRIYHIFLIWNIDVRSKAFEEDKAIQQPV